MKKIIYLLMGIMLGLVSCNSLDLSPEDYYAEGNFWKNEAQVTGFMTGIHKQLRDNTQTFYIMGELRGGLYRSEGSMGNGMDNAGIILQNLKISSPGYSNWADFYNNILQINIFINKLEKGLSFLTPEKTNFYLGQAYGIRAFYYFYLMRTWGAVPLVTEPRPALGETNPQALYTPRTPEAEILSFLKTEVSKSETCFANDDFTLNKSRAEWSKAATLVLKAEIYLWAAKVSINGQAPVSVTEDLQTAAKALNDLKASPKFRLLDDFTDVFAYNQKGNDEIILAIRFKNNEAEYADMKRFTYDIPTMASFYDKNGDPQGDPFNVGDKTILSKEFKLDFYDTFDDADSRKAATFYDFYKKENGQVVRAGVIMKKFLGMVDNGIRKYCDDQPIYRYADVLLLMAEIKNKQGLDPSAEINDIRHRAYGDNYPVYSDQGFELNELAILAERDKEFVHEGKRWFDVRRMQDATGKPLAFKLNVLPEAEAYKLLWPIDQGTITNDPTITENNPGYTN